MHIRLAFVTTRVQEDRMLPLTGKNMVVIGGSRGVGRRIVEAAIRNGAGVLCGSATGGSSPAIGPRKSRASKYYRSMRQMKAHPPKYSTVLQPEVHVPTVALAPIASAFSPASS